MARLADETRRSNARFFDAGAEVPERAITMGIGTILEARSILMLVTGAGKAHALAAAIERPPNTECPASALQHHPRVRIVCDEAAAGELATPRRDRARRKP